MNPSISTEPASRLRSAATTAGRLIRWLVGGLFLYMGLSKALHPVEFLKLLREYNLVAAPWLLNGIAATLPWFEAFCGFLLLSGVWARGSAVVLLGMLVPFTAVVAQRAWQIHLASGTPFCEIRFDCGCGMGEVVICHKMVENGLLILLALWLAWLPNRSTRLPAGAGETARPAP